MTIPKPPLVGTPEGRPPRKFPWTLASIIAVVLLIVAAIVVPELLPRRCIVEGTLVDTPAGPRPIEELRVGDEVCSRGSGGEARIGRIVRVLPARAAGYLRFSFEDGGVLCVTGEHPLATPAGFVAAKFLAPGATVVGREEMRTIAAVESRPSIVTVYDLEVEPEANFIAAGVLVHNKGDPDRYHSMSLKTLCSANADFRANDRDWNHANDFWVGDVAGLYVLESGYGADKGQPIKLIELSVAAADVAPMTAISKYAGPSPKAGYHFAVIPYQADGKPYDLGNNRNPSAFAFCAFPVEYDERWRRYTFIVNEENTIYRKKIPKPARIRQWPADLKAEGWEKLD
jgi:hypothetical protein